MSTDPLSSWWYDQQYSAGRKGGTNKINRTAVKVGHNNIGIRWIQLSTGNRGGLDEKECRNRSWWCWINLYLRMALSVMEKSLSTSYYISFDETKDGCHRHNKEHLSGGKLVAKCVV